LPLFFLVPQVIASQYQQQPRLPEMNLQTRYDLKVAEDEIAAKVARDVQPLKVPAGREP